MATRVMDVLIITETTRRRDFLGTVSPPYMAFFDRFFRRARAIFDRSFEGRLRERLRTATAYTIATIPEGRIGRIAGTARLAGEPLVAPLSGRACIAYRVLVDLAPGILDSAAGSRPERIGSVEHCVRFDVVDGAHHAVIEPRHVVLCSHPTHTEAAASGFNLTDTQRAVLDTMGRTTYVCENPGVVVLFESILAPGDPVGVLGAPVREGDPTVGLGYREMDTRPRFAGTPQLPLVIGAP